MFRSRFCYVYIYIYVCLQRERRWQKQADYANVMVAPSSEAALHALQFPPQAVRSQSTIWQE